MSGMAKRVCIGVLITMALAGSAGAAERQASQTLPQDAWKPSQPTAVNPTSYPVGTLPKDSWTPNSGRTPAAEGEPAAPALPIGRIHAGIGIIKNPAGITSTINLGYSHYQSDRFYIGGMVGIGQISTWGTGTAGNYTEGGLNAGYLLPLGGITKLSFEALIGAAAGNIAAGFGSTLLSAMIGADFSVGPTVSVMVGLKGCYTPATPTIGGYGFFLRVDFLRF